MKRLTLSLGMTFLGLTPISAAPAEKALVAIEEKSVKTLTENYAAAWNKHDTKTMASLWTEKGDYQSPVGDLATGKEAITKLFTADHGGRLKETKLVVKKQRVRDLPGGLALIDADLEMHGGKSPDGKTLQTFPHQVTAVVVKEGKDWKVLSWRAFLVLRQPGQ